MFRVCGLVKNFSVFRYQHDGIAKANFRVGLNASSFASQWNIGIIGFFSFFSEHFSSDVGGYKCFIYVLISF